MVTFSQPPSLVYFNFPIGLPLSPGVRIPIILFADDVVLLAETEDDLRQIVQLAMSFFTTHRLCLSQKKTKLLVAPPDSGHIVFLGDFPESPLRIEMVSSFKYLGLRICSRPYALFSDFNSHVAAKCDIYLHSYLSLLKSGPDRSLTALTLWKQVALPSILYGTECLPITQHTLKKIVKTQNSIGKFSLQVPSSSSNVQVFIDSGLLPVQFVLCQRLLSYVQKVQKKPSSNWASLSYRQSVEKNNRYYRYVMYYLSLLPTFPHFPLDISTAVRVAARNYTCDQLAFTPSSYVLQVPSLDTFGLPKRWLADSHYSEVYARFRSCNAGLGNRFPTLTGFSSKHCVFCESSGSTKLNNEIHLFIECPHFDSLRRTLPFFPILRAVLHSNPSASSEYLYAYLLNDSKLFIKDVQESLVHILRMWTTDIDSYL